MRVNDRILCIDGYQPSPDSAIYGLEPRYAAVQCENGSRRYLELFRERFADTDPTVEFLVDREGALLHVPNVRLIGFTPLMLLEAFLPVLVMGLGLLTVAAIVYTVPILVPRSTWSSHSSLRLLRRWFGVKRMWGGFRIVGQTPASSH